MSIAQKLSDMRLQLFRIEHEGDNHAKELAKGAQALLADATTELQDLSDEIDRIRAKYEK